jgi:hypothetical protein
MMAPASPAQSEGGGFSLGKVRVGAQKPRRIPPEPSQAAPSSDDALLELAATLDSDGGMPGSSLEVRASASVVALMAFVANGHTPSAGAFRSHVARLVQFLESLTALDPDKRKLVERALTVTRNGPVPPGDWLRMSKSGGDRWGQLSMAFLG